MFEATSESEQKMETKHSLDIFAILVLLFADILFTQNVGNFRLRLKKGPKAFWIAITVGTDFVHIFKSTATQHSFDGRA